MNVKRTVSIFLASGFLVLNLPSSSAAGWWDWFKGRPRAAKSPNAPKSLEERAREVGDVGIRPGKFAPDFELPKVGGGTVRLSSFRGEKAVILNFWATWCFPCRKEMPALEALSQANADQELVVVGVNLDADEPQAGSAVAFLNELGVTFPNVFDPRNQTAEKYAVHGLPVTYLISRRGLIVKRVFGDRDWMDPAVRKPVERLLLSPDSGKRTP
ncbi:MAG: TlpA disulfide reductase family protein [Nitrospinota bacterium]